MSKIWMLTSDLERLEKGESTTSMMLTDKVLVDSWTNDLGGKCYGSGDRLDPVTFTEIEVRRVTNESA
jgi:hypothetical protein